MPQEFDGPCYVISSNGFRLNVSYEDGWCYGKSRHIGNTGSDDTAREMIKDDIRRRPEERNGLPLYDVSDHGNISRRRPIRLKFKTARTESNRRIVDVALAAMKTTKENPS